METSSIVIALSMTLLEMTLQKKSNTFASAKAQLVADLSGRYQSCNKVITQVFIKIIFSEYQTGSVFEYCFDLPFSHWLGMKKVLLKDQACLEQSQSHKHLNPSLFLH